MDIGLAADVGTLQRLPKIIGSQVICKLTYWLCSKVGDWQGLVNELVLTGREFGAAEAKECGFVNRVLADREVWLECTVRGGK